MTETPNTDSITQIAPLDPEKFHVLNSTQKIWAGLGLAVLFFVVVPICGYFYYKTAINRPSQLGKETTVEIERGDTLSEIGNNFYSKGVINSEFLFLFYSRINGYDKKIQAGVYKIKDGITLVDLVNLIQLGKNDVKVTFLEGWRVEEFAAEAADKLPNIDYSTFVALAGSREGYLFPDTYNLNSDTREQALLDLLQNTFEEKTAKLLTTDALGKVKLTKQQVITLASIVEREIPNAEDRAVVAGLLLKRFNLGEMVGADATTQYIASRGRLGCKNLTDPTCPSEKIGMSAKWWPNDLTVDELAIDSPYNTRKVVGLPPTPICSPSLGSIESVLNYKESPYMYYLTDPKGNIHYAITLDEHNRNISNYLR